MAQPTPYEKQHDYSAEFPGTLGNALDEDLDDIETTLDEVCTNLEQIQRDDGSLQNSSVTPDSFNSAALTLIAADWTPRGFWATSTIYEVGDLIEVSGTGISYVNTTLHTSGVFVTDHAAGKWVIIGSAFGTSSPTVVDLTVTGNTILGDAAGDSVTINAGTLIIGSNFTATRAFGTLSAGLTSSPLNNRRTFTGNASGDSDLRTETFSFHMQGANAMANIRGLQSVISLEANARASGTAAVFSQVGLGTGTTGGGVSGAAVCYQAFHAFQSIAGSSNGSLEGLRVSAPTMDALNTATSIFGVRVAGISHANITNMAGILVEDQSGSTTMRALDLRLSSGSGKFNVYASGTAPNYLAGKLLVGSTSDPGAGYVGVFRDDTAGQSTLVRVVNADNTNAASHAYLNVVSGGSSGGDAGLVISITGASFILGMDNSDEDAFKVSVGTALGANDAVRIETDRGFGIPDGITAPTAQSGWAKLFVDTADGDLKVIFGDGTVKTIVVDT